jgi:hypothetical protein
MGRRRPAARADRTAWGIDRTFTGPGAAGQACTIILDALRPRIAGTSVDAYSDYRDCLPTSVETTQDRLRAKGRLRGRGDPGMDVRLDPADPCTHREPEPGVPDVRRRSRRIAGDDVVARMAG